MTNISEGVVQVHKIPDDLKSALLSDKVALSKWDSLTQLARNEWICWTVSVKQQKTRDEHVSRVVSELKEGMRRLCCWIGCIHRKDNKLSASVKGILERKGNK